MATIVVKIGSSSLVDPSGGLRDEVMRARVRDVVRLARYGHRPVLVTSGAVACGLGRMAIEERPGALPDLQAAAAIGQGVLFQRYLAHFTALQATPAQILLTSGDLDRRASYLNARATLERLLDWGAVPVVNENDTTATDELTFGDNDVLAAQVAILLRATWLILLTDREGLYRDGPEGPELVGDVPAEVGPAGIALAAMGSSAVGRGGVSSKIASAAMATAAGVTCVIASAFADGVIPGIASGHHIGTRFAPRPGGESAFRLWLRYAKPALGRIRIDDGAVRALEEMGTSLLPVGVTACEGAFVAGDAVEVVRARDGVVVGKGVSSYSADELRRVAGLRTAQAREVLPDAAEEVIHRDRFVLAREPGRA